MHGPSASPQKPPTDQVLDYNFTTKSTKLTKKYQQVKDLIEASQQRNYPPRKLTESYRHYLMLKGPRFAGVPIDVYRNQWGALEG